MEDNDKKVKNKDKNFKKPSGKSATGKPLEAIEMHPQQDNVIPSGYRAEEYRSLTPANRAYAIAQASARARLAEQKTINPIEEIFGQDLDKNTLIRTIEEMAILHRQKGSSLVPTLEKMLEAVIPHDMINESLIKKSNKTGIPFWTLSEVYNRGVEEWTGGSMTREQYAFARVNSYISQGKAYELDSDLREETNVNTELNEQFAALFEKKGPCWKGYQMVGMKKGKKGRPVPNCVPEEAEIEESNNTPYVRPHIEKGNTKQTAWKASNKHGKVKYFGMDFKKSALRHAGIDEAVVAGETDPKHQKQSKDPNDSSSRYDATKSLVKIYKSDTPGQKIKESLDESFKLAFSTGVGVTLTSQDVGMKMRSAFAHHPDTVEEMEEDVESALKQPVYMPPERHADGTWGQARTVMRKTNRKIIGGGNSHDGKKDGGPE